MAILRYEQFIKESYEQAVRNIRGKVLAYHGTPYGEFDSFQHDKRGSGADRGTPGDFGNGFYFTPEKALAIKYAHNLTKDGIGLGKPCLYKAELTMNKPFDFDLLSTYHSMSTNMLFKSGYRNVTDEMHFQLLSALNTTEREIQFMSEIEGSIADNWGDWDIAGILKAEGYDSLINHNGREYVIFDPEQIKIIKRELL